jgi:hypothetical protein
MMTPLDTLRQDYTALSELLAARRAVTIVTLPVGVQLLWTIYITILEDAVTTLNSLIHYLSPQLDVQDR